MYRMDALLGLYCSRALTFLHGMSGGALRLPVRPLDIYTEAAVERRGTPLVERGMVE